MHIIPIYFKHIKSLIPHYIVYLMLMLCILGVKYQKEYETVYDKPWTIGVIMEGYEDGYYNGLIKYLNNSFDTYELKDIHGSLEEATTYNNYDGYIIIPQEVSFIDNKAENIQIKTNGNNNLSDEISNRITIYIQSIQEEYNANHDMITSYERINQVDKNLKNEILWESLDIVGYVIFSLSLITTCSLFWVFHDKNIMNRIYLTNTTTAVLYRDLFVVVLVFAIGLSTMVSFIILLISNVEKVDFSYVNYLLNLYSISLCGIAIGCVLTLISHKLKSLIYYYILPMILAIGSNMLVSLHITNEYIIKLCKYQPLYWFHSNVVMLQDINKGVSIYPEFLLNICIIVLFAFIYLTIYIVYIHKETAVEFNKNQ